MPVWLQVTLAIGVPVLTVSASAVVTYITKYAPDAQAAKKQFAAIGLSILKWVGILLMAAGLVANLISTEPLTRIVVFSIAAQLVGLSSLALIALLDRATNVLAEIVRIMEKQNEHAGRHLDVTTGILGSVKQVAQEVEKGQVEKHQVDTQLPKE